jgi:hypothetical protein
VRDYAAWARHNRMAASFTVYCSHAWQAIIAENKEAFDEHPEYLAQVGGKRQGEQLCVSNPALRELAVRWALATSRRTPPRTWCRWRRPTAAASASASLPEARTDLRPRVRLANEVARSVAREYPGKMVGLYAYNEHSEPPGFAWSPTSTCSSPPGSRAAATPSTSCWSCGRRSARTWGITSTSRSGPGTTTCSRRPRQRPRLPAQADPPLRERGATSLDCESSGNWGLNGRGYYVAHKLMWDPEGRRRRDPGRLLRQGVRPCLGDDEAVLRAV